MANQYGLTSNGFVLPTYEDIYFDVTVRMRQEMPNLCFDEGTVERGIADVIANETYCMWNALYSLYTANDPNFATGCNLNTVGSRLGVFRNDGETDQDYRLRILSLGSNSQVSGSSCFNTLYTQLYSINGVSDVQVNINDTSNQLGVLPPNSYEVMVIGGDESSIANTIWNNHPVGITLSGNTNAQIVDCTGVCRNINFTRPRLVPIYLDIRVERLSSNCACPTDDTSIIKNAIIEAIGEDDGLCYTRIGQPINVKDFFSAIYSVRGIGITCALMSRDGLCAKREFITLKRNEVPVFNEDCINVEFTSAGSTPCDTGNYKCPPEECQFTLDITKVANKSEFTSVGEIIEYTFTVTNTGVAPLSSSVVISDDKASVSCPALPADGLAVGDSIECTALYETTYQDAIDGFVVNSAQAVSDNNFSPTVQLSVPYNGPDLFASMNLTKTLASGVCDAVGNILVYEYTITNTGNVPITGQPLITDNRINEVICPPLPVDGLLPNQSISTTAQTVVTQEMIDDGEICNTARANAQTPLGNLVSNAVTLCIDCGSGVGDNPPTAPEDALLQDCVNDFPYTTPAFTDDAGTPSLSDNGTAAPLNLSLTDNLDGTATLTPTGPVSNGTVTVTATDSGGNTSDMDIVINCPSLSRIDVDGTCADDGAFPEPIVYCGYGAVPTGNTTGIGNSISGDFCGVSVTRIMVNDGLTGGFRLYLDTTSPLPASTEIFITNGTTSVTIPISGGSTSYVINLSGTDGGNLNIIMNGEFSAYLDC